MKCSVLARCAVAHHEDGFLAHCHARSQSLGCGTDPCKSSSSSSELGKRTRNGSGGALNAATARMSALLRKATHATALGEVFDDAATGQALLNTLLRAWNSGAITLEEVAATGLTEGELRGRSFVKILEGRKGG